MTRKYKTSYKTHRNSRRFSVAFDAPAIAAQVQEVCTICGGEIEESPMMRGVCYSCYRDIIGKEQRKAQQIVLDVASTSAPEPENLGTRFIISGGEVMELDTHLESQYELNTEEDMPF